jgi:hypothetical protein
VNLREFGGKRARLGSQENRDVVLLVVLLIEVHRLLAVAHRPRDAEVA